jgi:osmoprotectant transport system substrate-binding protein
VLLEDDKGLFAADNIFPVFSQDVYDAYGNDLVSLLDEISGELTTDDLIAMNKRYDVDKDDAEDIATDWLDDHGFGD